jgi:hypothetical protein
MGLRLSVLLPMGAALALTSAIAGASPSYPVLIQQDLGGSTCAPACTVCHRDNSGGVGTVVTPFGRSMMGLGLVAESPASLKSALEKEEASQTDSNGDGVSDIDALMACEDPNQVLVGDGGGGGNGGNASSAAAFQDQDPTPEYGCALGRAPRGNGAAWAVVMGALLAGTFGRRRIR